MVRELSCAELTTVGCRGADGFFRCAVTYIAEAAVAARVSSVAPPLRTHAFIRQTAATAAWRKGTRSNLAPSISPESAPRWPPRISW